MRSEVRQDATDVAALRSRLGNVYWIGGGSGAGKTTIARRLAVRHGFQVYDTDAVMPEHARRTTAEDAPYLSLFTAMDMDERWVNRSPETMLETFHWYRGEGFDLIVEDLLNLSVDTRVIVEGFRLLPHLVKPLLADASHAVWLLPTHQFREAAFESRGTTWDIPRRTSDPARARRNLLERDRMFTDRISEETKHLHLPRIEVDAGMSEDELADRVARAFALFD